ncbi:MAG: isopentenyl-diphosphate Delta-isomerase, partial [Patescibacteria group bacterium]|nr:isopentenyl-diphosphate Delta-isomerase [Patescibacteria group bacterium]
MTNQDQVTLITEQDEVIGTMDKIEAHRGDGKLHRASSVFLFKKSEDGEVELLVQQRSDKKIVGAGQWANTV